MCWTGKNWFFFAAADLGLWYHYEFHIRIPNTGQLPPTPKYNNRDSGQGGSYGGSRGGGWRGGTGRGRGGGRGKNWQYPATKQKSDILLSSVELNLFNCALYFKRKNLRSLYCRIYFWKKYIGSMSERGKKSNHLFSDSRWISITIVTSVYNVNIPDWNKLPLRGDDLI